jgi:hypothetical protein
MLRELIIVLTFVELVWHVLDGPEFESQSEESFSSKSSIQLWDSGGFSRGKTVGM